MSDNKSNEARRKVIKSIAAGGAIAAGKSLPEEWSKPVVDSVFLPAHAQNSPPTATVTFHQAGLRLPETWTIPAGITQITVYARGDVGGDGGSAGGSGTDGELGGGGGFQKWISRDFMNVCS